MSRKNWILVNISSREIAKGRRGKPILSERPRDVEGNLTFPPGYSQRAGWHWATVEGEAPPIPHGHELAGEPTYHWEDFQKAIITRRHEIKPIKGAKH